MRPDHNTYREWLNLEVDGALPGEHQGELQEHLAACAGCRAEKEGLVALEELIRAHRVAVRPELRRDVLAALPSAGWESRSPRTWAFPAAVFVLLVGVSVFALGGRSHSPLLSALAAVAGMLRASAVAGAGLIAASWKGLGLVFSEILSSPMSIGALGIFVLCLNLLLVSLLRRKRSLPADVLRRRE